MKQSRSKNEYLWFFKEKGKKIFNSDKADYHWESAVDEYRKMYKREMSDLDETEENIIWEYAGNHIAFFSDLDNTK